MTDNDICCCELPVLGLRFTLSTPVQVFPNLTGGVLRSGLGPALKSVDPDAYGALFTRAQYGNQDRFPWRLVVFPSYPGRLVFEFLLFGSLTRFAISLEAAVRSIADGGLGKAKFRSQVLCVDLRKPDGSYSQLSPDLGIRTAVPLSLIAQRDIPDKADWVAIHLRSSLRLKHEDLFTNTPPSFELLFQKLAERASQLAGQAGHPLDYPHNWRATAAKVALLRADTQWHEFSQYSARQKTLQKYGGLVGELVYTGPVAPFLPWLRAAEWLGIGKNTTFGLGNVSITVG